MDTEAKRNFIIFLEKNPKLYAIAKSNRCIALLERLSLQGLPIEELKRESKFSYLSEQDLQDLLELLVQLKVLDKQKLIGKIIYYANENTKIFLEIYNETKKQYSVD
jgi:hypothetical protein